MYRKPFTERRTSRESRADYGILAVLVSCIVIWAGFAYVLVKWAGWLA